MGKYGTQKEKTNFYFWLLTAATDFLIFIP